MNKKPPRSLKWVVSDDDEVVGAIVNGISYDMVGVMENTHLHGWLHHFLRRHSAAIG